MLNESQFLLSLDGLKSVLIHGLTIFDVALVYVLVYVVYKALGRYIYFKPQEHASKINRTFLVLSLLIVSLHFLDGITSHLPFLPEYRWLYALCGLALLIAPMSILMDRVVWKYDRHGDRSQRYWNYMPIPKDYYEAPVGKRLTEGNTTTSWEEKGVESTRENLHSDALLNGLALIVFIITGMKWAYESTLIYGWYSLAFSAIIFLWIAAAFLDRSVFSWMEYVEQEIRRRSFLPDKNKKTSGT